MASYILGLDLGGTKVSAAVFDAENQILSRARAKSRAWRDQEEVFDTIVQVGHKAIERSGVSAKKIAAVGIGSPGPLDPDTGYVIESANLSFTNFPLGPRLSEEFKCPAVIDNDVNVGTYGEFKAGAASDARDALGIFVGTGIGGGIIINGKLYHGFSKNAGEVGHIVIKADGPRCGCGRRGCLESLASRVAITRDIRRAVKQGERTQLAKIAEKKNEIIPSNALKKAYKDGDKVAVKVLDNAARYIGIGIGSLVNVLGPEVVVLGGGVVEAMGDGFIERIERTARKVAFDFAIKEVRFVRAGLGDDAGMVGAAMLARDAVKRAASKKRKK